MSIKPKDFFKEKRTWSVVKDKILGWYLIPYLNKVKNLGRLIVIVDGFAGPGLYEDGSDGSPLIICKVIENLKSKGVKAIAILIDSNEYCFNKLKQSLKKFEIEKLALPLEGDFKTLVPKIIKATKDCPSFFFIDPFGIKGLEFNSLEEIFKKVNRISTEVLVNFNYKALLREYKINPSLTDGVMGGDYYRNTLEDSKISDSDKEKKIIEMYKDKYKNFFTYVGSCPVMYKDEQMAKYHLIFATSHFDGFKLMNEKMCDIHREFYTEGRLFQVFSEGEKPDRNFLENEIINLLKNKVRSRKEVKEILMIKCFLRFKESDYNQTINKFLKENKIYSDNRKIRINDDNLLSLVRF